MVYRIQYDINSSLTPIFEKIKKFGDFIFTNSTIYIHTKVNKSNILLELKGLLPPEDQIMIIEVNKDNLFQQTDNIKAWTIKMWKKEELEKLENEQQEAIFNHNKFLDQFKEELEKQLKQKKEDEHG